MTDRIAVAWAEPPPAPLEYLAKCLYRAEGALADWEWALDRVQAHYRARARALMPSLLDPKAREAGLLLTVKD
jgi:hypothetical protein